MVSFVPCHGPIIDKKTELEGLEFAQLPSGPGGDWKPERLTLHPCALKGGIEMPALAESEIHPRLTSRMH